MTQSPAFLRRLLTGRDGFAMPVAIFALVIMGTLAVASIITALDETRSSRAMIQSAEAFYAAEAGLNQAWSTWNLAQVGAVDPGQELDLGWDTLQSGARYRALVRRVDNEIPDQPLYWVRVESRGADDAGGQRVLSLFLTVGENHPFEQAAVVNRGQLHLGDDDRAAGPDCGWGCRTNGLPWIAGQDGSPTSWDPSVCQVPPQNKPAILTENAGDLDLHPENDGFHQAPQPASQSITDPILQDPAISDATFSQFGSLSRDQLIAMANHTFPPWNGSPQGTTYPTVNCADGNGILFSQSLQPQTCTCDTGNRMNWGSPDPAHPCFNYHPIIYLPDGAEIRGTAPDGSCGYGQAIVIANGPVKFGHHDCDGGIAGANPNLQPYEFAGIAVITGCLELVYGTTFHGTALVDDDMSGSTHPDCDVSGGFEGNGVVANMNATYQFSRCAVQKALDANHLDPAVRGFRKLGSRAYMEEPL